MSWIQTYTGRKFDFKDPRSSEAHISDIAHALSMQCRFAGHTRQFYSVAQHSVLVGDNVTNKAGEIIQSLRFEALMHDAHEAFIGDISSPLKCCIDVGDTDRNVANHIRESFNLPHGNSPWVHDADLRLLATEARDLLVGGPINNWTKNLPAPLEQRIVPLSQQESKDLFLERFQELYAAHLMESLESI